MRGHLDGLTWDMLRRPATSRTDWSWNFNASITSRCRSGSDATAAWIASTSMSSWPVSSTPNGCSASPAISCAMTRRSRLMTSIPAGEGHRIEPRREGPAGIVGLPGAMNGQQRFLHDVVDPRHRTEARAEKLARRRSQEHKQRRIRGLIAGLREPHETGRFALLFDRHRANLLLKVLRRWRSTGYSEALGTLG